MKEHSQEVPLNAPKKRQKRGSKPKPTAKQKRFIEIFTANALSLGVGSKSIPEMLREAGYADESARQMINVLAGIQPHLAPIEDRIASHREKIMERMEEQVKYADYGQLVRGLEATTKTHRLLTGKTTANVGVILGDRRGEIDRLINE